MAINQRCRCWKLYSILGMLFIIAVQSQIYHGPVDEDGNHLDIPEPDSDEDDVSDEDAQAVEDEEVFEPGELTEDQIRALHAKIDANGDRRMTKDEAVAFALKAQHSVASKEAKEMFQDMDENKDKKVDLEEFMTHKYGQPDADPENPTPEQVAEAAALKKDKDLDIARFKAADKDAKGFLNEDEVTAVMYPETHDGLLHITSVHNLKSKDRDGDGMLSHEEMWETHMPNAYDEESLAELKKDFESLDLDKNGKLDLAELKRWDSGAYHYEGALKDVFEIADEDQDGVITAEELRDSADALANSQFASHMLEWVEHFEL